MGLQQDIVQLRTELDNIRLQINKLHGRLVEIENSLGSNDLSSIDRPCEVSLGTRRVTLEDFLVEVLQNSNEPLTAKELADLVIEAGYKTKAKKNFVGIILQTLVRSPVIRRATRGKTRPTRYALIEE